MDLVALTPSEFSGSNTSGKYDYQKDVSICMLLTYHSEVDDYLFLFDYHDDLVVINSETNPSKYHFFQIKSKENGTWSLNSILKRKPGKNGNKLNSILGKMYSHKKNFGENVESLNFISNAIYGFNNTQKNEVCLKELTPEEGTKILKSIEDEFAPDVIANSFLDITYFKVNSLSTMDSSGHTKGKLSEFLYERSNGGKYNVELIYQTIFDEVKLKTKFSSKVKDFEELKKAKGISKSYFEQILKTIGENIDYSQIWVSVNNELLIAGVSFGERILYKDLWNRLEVERMNPVNRILRQCIRDIKKIIQSYKDENRFEGMDIIAVKDKVWGAYNGLNRMYPFEEKYLHTIIFAELHD